MNSQKLLDRLELYDGNIVTGIIDFVNKKHIHIFDFTNSNDPNLILLAMLWRTDPETNLRFSVYATINAPQIQVPSIKLIHKNNVKTSNCKIITTESELIEKKNVKASVDDSNQ